MSRVLLLNPPGKELYLRDQHCSSVSKAYYYWPPIDLIMLSGILSREHKDILVIDAIIDNMEEEACSKKICEYRPDYVIFITGIVSWVEDFRFMQNVKNATGAKIIASGGFLLTDFRSVMENFNFLDAILMDYTSDSILSYIRGDENLNDICFRRGDEVIVTPCRKLREFNIPVPLHELFPLSNYRLPHNRYSPFASMMTNYGCPFECSYCIAEHIDFKYRPVENIIPEIEKLVLSGVREIFFKDFTFGVPRNIAKQLCEEIISRFPTLSWICASRVNVLDEELLRLMKRAGCHTIQFGVESSSQELLDSNNKKATVEQTINIFRLCRRLGIKTLAHFILGLPGETEGSLIQTIKLAKEIRCDYASFNVAIPLPGTTLRKRCIENNWIVGDDEVLDSSTGYPVIETPLLSRERLWELRNHALRSYYLRPAYVLDKLVSIRTPKDLVFLCKEALSLLSTIKK